VVGRTWDFGYWYPEYREQRILAKKVLEEALPNWNDHQVMRTIQARRDFLGQMFSLPLVEDGRRQASVIFVPPRLFDAMKMMVKNGWGPLVPLWVSPSTYVYNGAYNRGCGSGVITVDDMATGDKMSRLLMNTVNVFNLHIPDHPTSQFVDAPSPQWEDTFIGACHSLASQPPPDSRDMYHALGLAAVRDVPIALRTSEEFHYWQVHRAEEKGDRYERHYDVSVRDNDDADFQVKGT
jgi:hypothetical protein